MNVTLRYPLHAEFERMTRALEGAGGRLLEDDTMLYKSLYRAVEVALGYDTRAHPHQHDHCTWLTNFCHQHLIREEMTTASIRLLHANILPPETEGVFVYDGERRSQQVLRGEYRTIDTYLKDTEDKEVAFAPHEQIDTALEAAVAAHNNSPRKIHDIARFFLTYNAIHPFMDGNGRVERLLLEALLLGSGYYPALLKKSYSQHFDTVREIMSRYTCFPSQQEEAVEDFVRFLLYRCYKAVYFAS